MPSLRTAILFMLSAAAMTMHARKADSDLIDIDRPYRWEAGFMAGLNNDGCEVDCSIAYFPIPYVGLRATIGFSGEIPQVEDWDWGYDYDYYPVSTSGGDYTERFRFSPSIVLRTPRIFYWEKQDMVFRLFAEPGFFLSPGASGSKNPRTCGYIVKAGILATVDWISITLGYSNSNFSLYSGNPYSYYSTPKNCDHTTHSVFIGFSFSF